MPESQIHSGDLKLAYRDEGDADQAVVLLHGFPFDSNLWRRQVEVLAPHYRVIVPDLRGFGSSPLSEPPYSLSDLARDVVQVLDVLKLDRVAVAGLSMGGYVAFELYRQHPERVGALILADTRPQPDSPEAQRNRARMAGLARREGAAPVVEALLPKLLTRSSRDRRPEVERRLREMMEAADPQAIAAALMAMAVRTDSQPLLPDIAVPVLVIVGADDALAPPAEARVWTAAIPGAQLEVIEDAGHVSNLEQPDRFNTLLLDFLAASAPRRPRTTPTGP